MDKKYRITESACRLMIFSQALVINATPLLFVIFQNFFKITTFQLTSLVLLMFIAQLLIDGFSAPFIDKIGYKNSGILASALTFIGLILLSVCPIIMEKTYLALVIATIFMALGAGFLEVVVSPLSNSIPSSDKNSGMCLLHSFYCWGHLFIILFTTLFLVIFQKTLWYVIPLICATIPLLCIILLFLSKVDEKREQVIHTKSEKLFGNKLFIALLFMMISSGGLEQAVAQWSSFFAEAGLGVTPEVGNVIGPAVFALFMGITRLYFGLKGEKFNPSKTVFYCGIGCALSLAVIVFAPHPIVSLIGCGLIGLFTGPLWPTVLTIASQSFPKAGTRLFASISLFGDLGCIVGPALVGGATSIVEKTSLLMPFTDNALESGLKLGLLLCLLLAITLILLTSYVVKKQKTQKFEN